jgi:predicted enzyme related to lactoylglutathione lyase
MRDKLLTGGEAVSRSETMASTAVTGSPGFISIAVSDVRRSAEFYERYLGAVRDTFDFGPNAIAFVGWPAFALSSLRRPEQPGPSPDTTTILLWWRASDAQALYERAQADGVPIVAEPFDGPFGRTFAMSDPDGYRITIYEKDQPLFWPPR